jgi:hypothetical protein
MERGLGIVAVVALVVSGCAGSSPATGSITWNPSTISCSNPTALTITVKLPSSVKPSDSLLFQETPGGPDGYANFFRHDDLPGLSGVTPKQDGSWEVTSTATAAAVAEACAGRPSTKAGQVAMDMGVFAAPGTHTWQIAVNSYKNVVAEGSLTLTP